MAKNNSPEGIDIENLPLGVLLKHLSVGSWVWLIGIVGGVFLLGYQTPGFLGKTMSSEVFQEQQSKYQVAEQNVLRLETEVTKKQGLNADLEKTLSETCEVAQQDLSEVREANSQLSSSFAMLETRFAAQVEKSNDQNSMIDTLTVDLEDQRSVLHSCITEKTTIDGQKTALETRIVSCSSRLENATVDLWYVHQGEGRGYPEGNNSDVHNHDDRSNWNSRRFKTETCLKFGGPPINEAYARAICGSKKAIGPLGVLDIGGGTCGHGVYVIGCMN